MDIYAANLERSLIPPQYMGEFEQQLTDTSNLTLVFTMESRVVACGMVSYSPQEASACLSYGLVHPAFQRQGIGSMMLLTRMSLLEPSPERPCTVYLSATCHSKGFFSRHGFGSRGTECDQHGNEFETFYFLLTPAISESIRQTLQRVGVPFDATLRVPTIELQSHDPTTD